MEGAGCDEEDVIGLDRSMLGRNRRAFDQGQEIALHTLARHIGAATAFPRADLVDLVEKDDPIIFDLADRFPNDLLLIHQLFAFLRDQGLVRIPDRRAPWLGALAE